MSAILRGVRNTFRNSIRTISVVIILGLSIGLALTMLVSRQAVGDKIASVKSSIANVITVSPAGARGFAGGGEPLTTTQMTQIQNQAHVTAVTETLTDRLDASGTNLQSAITAGSLGRRFAGGGNGEGAGGGTSGAAGGTAPTTFTPPIIVIGTNDPASAQSLAGGAGGGGSVSLTSGKLFDGTVDAQDAVVGKDLATKNNLTLNSTFTAYSTTFTVVGIYDAGNTFSNSSVIMSLPTVQRLSGQAGDVTAAVVQVDSITNVDSVTNAIKNALGSAADVTSAQDSSAQALAPLQNIQSISLISVIGAVIAGAVIILLTMLMIVRERRREIGVLKAIGAGNLTIMWQFISEAITFTLISLVIGLGIGVAGAEPVTRALVSTSSNSSSSGGGAAGTRGGFGGGAAGRFLNSNSNLRNIHAAVSWQILLWGLLAAIVIAVVGSAIPALFIAKVRPAEVMRSE